MKRSWFTRFANTSSRFAGKPITFLLALGVVVVWGISGPIFHYSDTWQLVINTGTTIVTFMMVFLIQNTQNRDGYALQVKLDELIRAFEGAHNALLDLEELDDETLESIRKRYTNLAEKARKGIRNGKLDIGSDELDENFDAEEISGSEKVRQDKS